jgi:hypothetical protein
MAISNITIQPREIFPIVGDFSFLVLRPLAPDLKYTGKYQIDIR